MSTHLSSPPVACTSLVPSRRGDDAKTVALLSPDACHCLAPVPSLSWRSDRLGSLRFVSLEIRLMRLHYANAYISTLGGGFFLCRFVDEALCMALAQMRIASAIESESLCARCCIHFVYCCIQTGRFRAARGLLERLARVARDIDDETLAGMVAAGLLRCASTEGAWTAGRLLVLPRISPAQVVAAEQQSDAAAAPAPLASSVSAASATPGMASIELSPPDGGRSRRHLRVENGNGNGGGSSASDARSSDIFDGQILIGSCTAGDMRTAPAANRRATVETTLSVAEASRNDGASCTGAMPSSTTEVEASSRCRPSAAVVDSSPQGSLSSPLGDERHALAVSSAWSGGGHALGRGEGGDNVARYNEYFRQHLVLVGKGIDVARISRHAVEFVEWLVYRKQRRSMR